MMKPSICLWLCVVLSFVAVACGGGTEDSVSEVASLPTVEEVASSPTAEEVASPSTVEQAAPPPTAAEVAPTATSDGGGASDSAPLSLDPATVDFDSVHPTAADVAAQFEDELPLPFEPGDSGDNAGKTLRSLCGQPPALVGAKAGSLRELVATDGAVGMSVTTSVSLFSPEDMTAAVTQSQESAANCDGFVNDVDGLSYIVAGRGEELVINGLKAFGASLGDDDFVLVVVNEQSLVQIVDLVVVRGQIVGEMRVVNATRSFGVPTLEQLGVDFIDAIETIAQV